MTDPHTCSGICAIYSIVGMIFMCWVGIMLQTQPFFVSGIKDPVESAKAAYGAAGMFIFCFIVSVCGLFCTSRHNIPDIVSHLSELDDQDIYRTQMQRHFPIPNYEGESPYIQRAVNSNHRKNNAAATSSSPRAASGNTTTTTTTTTTTVRQTGAGGNRGSSGNLRRRSGDPKNDIITIELTSSKDETTTNNSNNNGGVDSPLSSPLRQKGQEVEDLLGLDSGEFI